MQYVLINLVNQVSIFFNVLWEIINHRHQRYIGKVKHAVFHTQRSGRKRVVVSTEENVIASLDLRHGDICEFSCK